MIILRSPYQPQCSDNRGPNPQGKVCMKTTNVEVHTNRDWKIGIIVLSAMALLAICPASYGQVLIGTPGAGWQTWTTADLTDNAAPFWDVPWAAFGTASGTVAGYSGNALADKNPGFCLTSTGDCVGMGSAANAPGVMPYWGLPYDSSADDPAGGAPGARDNTVYFRST